MSKVAKAPTTLQEALNSSPEDLQQLSADQLQGVHTIVQSGSTKAAKRMLDLLDAMIKTKRKEARKAPQEPPKASEPEKTPEPALTSAKTKRRPPVKPAGNAGKKPEPAKKPEPSKQPETPKAEEGPFPVVIPGKNKDQFVRLDVESVEDLGAILVENPYAVYMFMDEKLDNELTQLLIVYASDITILAIDKNRNEESFLHLDGKMMKQKAYTLTEGKQKYNFPFAIYLRGPVEA